MNNVASIHFSGLSSTLSVVKDQTARKMEGDVAGLKKPLGSTPAQGLYALFELVDVKCCPEVLRRRCLR
jgi:hypothetical protein